VKLPENGLILFSASWCAPCKSLKRKLEDIHHVVVDVDENPKIAQAFGVRGVPTLMKLKNGQEAARLVGDVPIEKVRAM
jgi:thioredoxin-like negative regulator of GroEL